MQTIYNTIISTEKETCLRQRGLVPLNDKGR